MSKIKYGMVGGDLGAFIGGVHRRAISFDPRVELVAGCFNPDEKRNIATAKAYHLDDTRVYKDYRSMAKAESERQDGIDFAVIVTPNHLHYEMCKEFLLAGTHVVCEKPLCFTVEQAKELKQIAKDKGLLLGVTYTYTGYAMAKVMKEMIEQGDIGDIVSINAEYAQDWLIDELEEEGGKDTSLSVWRMDPQKSGRSNCVGDIGTHIEGMVSYLTGLKIKKLLATIDKFGKPLELNANMIVEYDNGARGAYWCTQVASGCLNGLSVRIYGSKGSLEWQQHYPDYVRYTPKGEATRVLSRGCGYITGDSAKVSRLPSGHPEGLTTAFANIYRNIVTAIEQQKQGVDITETDFPNVDYGIEGVKFVHAVIDSAEKGSAWIEL